MSVSVRRDNREVVVPEHPPGLVQLQWESDRIRSLATRAVQGVTYGQWSDFADHMKEEFCKFGIAATVDGNDLEPLRQSLRDSVASFARADSDVTTQQKTKEVLN